MKTLDVLKEVLAGKRMSESSMRNYEAVLSSFNEFSRLCPIGVTLLKQAKLIALRCSTGV